MKKRTRLFCWIVIVVVVVVCILCWQMSKLSRGLRTMPLHGATEVLVGALSSRVLAPGLDEGIPKPNGPSPLLDEYRIDPALTRQRYLLVMTWVNASQIFKAVGYHQPFESLMVSSATAAGIPPEHRIDGWGNPYCILADEKQMTFLSSGGNGPLNCEMLRQTAQQAASRSTDSRLTKEGNLLVAVYKRGEDVSVNQFQ
jgi:hypothetical protein